METMKYNFKVNVLRPDKRQYKQQSLELEPIGDLFVQVALERKFEYFANFEAVTTAELVGDVKETLILSPAGLAEIMHQLEQYLKDDEVTSEDFKPVTEPTKKATENWDDAGEDDWGTTTAAPVGSAKVATDDADDWGKDDNKEAKEDFNVDEEW